MWAKTRRGEVLHWWSPEKETKDYIMSTCGICYGKGNLRKSSKNTAKCILCEKRMEAKL
jgi:hypothetical protein